MKFEEQFPSLHKKVNPFGSTTTWRTMCLIRTEREQGIIQNHCLDKQKVKDTIIKYLRGGEFSEEKQWALNRILKELGLTEDK